MHVVRTAAGLAMLCIWGAAGAACGSNGTSSGTGGAPGSGGTASTGGSSGGAGGGMSSGGSGDAGGSTGHGGSPSGGAAGGSASGGGPGAGGSGGKGGAGAVDAASGGAGGTGGGPSDGAVGGAGGSSTGATGGSAGAGGTVGSGGSGGAAGAPSTSVGCGLTGPMPKSGRATIDVGGTAREYILTLPSKYDSGHPYPLILAFHGARYDAQSVADGGPPGSGPYYGIQAEAKDGAIFVAPQATSSGFGSNDVAYVQAMVARFKSELCLDQKRIFATGFSMGAMMTITLGCVIPETFRAIAPMSGQVSGTCSGTAPLAYWSSHGTEDSTIRPSNGEAARDTFVKRNHCGNQTVPGTPAGCVSYQGCDAGYPVTWCTFTGEHEPAPFAGSAIWSFFSSL